MDLKVSKYNLVREIKGEYFIFNTINWCLYKISKELYNFLLENKDKSISDDDAERKCAKVGYENGFIVDKELDEFSWAKYTVEKAFYNNDLRMTILPTDACNFRCLYCYENAGHHHMSDEAEKALVNFFKRNINKYNSVYIEWLGGEPLLQKHRIINIMTELKEICSQNKKSLVAEIISNAYELDVDTFKALVENHVYYYQLTLDFPEEYHNIMRPHKSGKVNTFERIKNNLLSIHNEVKNSFYKIILRVNITNKNYDAFLNNSIEDCIKEFKEILDNNSHFSLEFEPVIDWGGNRISAIESELIDSNKIVNLYNNANVRNIRPITPFFDSVGSRCCYSLKASGYVINYDANVYKCSRTLSSDKYNMLKEKNHLGKIMPNGELVIDEKKNSQWVQIHDNDVDPKCKACPLVVHCALLACPARRLKGEKKIDSCEFNKEMKLIEASIKYYVQKKKYVDLTN